MGFRGTSYCGCGVLFGVVVDSGIPDVRVLKQEGVNKVAKWKIKKIGTPLTAVIEAEDAGEALVKSGLNPSFWVVQGKVKKGGKKGEAAKESDNKVDSGQKESDSKAKPAEQSSDSKTEDEAAKE